MVVEVAVHDRWFDCILGRASMMRRRDDDDAVGVMTKTDVRFRVFFGLRDDPDAIIRLMGQVMGELLQ